MIWLQFMQKEGNTANRSGSVEGQTFSQTIHRAVSNAISRPYFNKLK